MNKVFAHRLASALTRVVVCALVVDVFAGAALAQDEGMHELWGDLQGIQAEPMARMALLGSTWRKPDAVSAHLPDGHPSWDRFIEMIDGVGLTR